MTELETMRHNLETVISRYCELDGIQILADFERLVREDERQKQVCHCEKCSLERAEEKP